MVILALRSITDGSQLTEAEQLRLQKETAEIIALLQDKLFFSAFADKNFLERFSWQWYYVKNKVLFDIPVDEEYSRPQNRITPNFLALDLAAELNSYIGQKYGKHLRMSQIQPLFYSLQEFVEQKIATAFSCRMAIVSVYGSPYASFLADRIKKEYGFYIKETVVMEYTQLNDSVDECFDFLATDLRVHMRPAFQKCRVLEINTSEHSKNLLPELDRFFQKKMADARSALVSSEVLETHKVTSEKLLLLLAGKSAERLPSDSGDPLLSEKAPEQPCVIAERLEKEMLFLRCESERNEDYVKIYHCSEKVKWGNFSVRTIVCYSYSGKDAQKLYYLNQVLTGLEQKNAL
ncbi:MAG: hypothetical protein LUD18_15175 [Lachnospiraceae bacterium]|nr:hypothetical protein [Lachnospiraceae bacterium]